MAQGSAEKRNCRWCTYPLDLAECDHIDCMKSKARGFCSTTCARYWDQEKAYILEKAASN